jgi:Pentapeptide repeats (8 copies)
LLYGDISNASPDARLQAASTFRTAVVAGLAGLAALGSLAMATRTYRLTQQGQITDRYTKAIDQLGSDRLETRLGGIYALERIAVDSERDHRTVVEVLGAFAREQSRQPTPPNKSDAATVARVASDVEAAVTVLGRLPDRFDRFDTRWVDLSSVYLVGAVLWKADLRVTDLPGADLRKAALRKAALRKAALREADLREAGLWRANLQGANLWEADLRKADLRKADLQGAVLWKADLRGADLREANLDGVRLGERSAAQLRSGRMGSTGKQPGSCSERKRTRTNASEGVPGAWRAVAAVMASGPSPPARPSRQPSRRCRSRHRASAMSASCPAPWCCGVAAGASRPGGPGRHRSNCSGGSSGRSRAAPTAWA